MNKEVNIFSGLRVLELSSVLAGPSVGMFFAELGAEVIKVENIHTKGDITRQWKLVTEEPDTDISAYFSCVNWGKKSIAIDISRVEGLDIIYDLTAVSEIVIVNFKPGDAEKLKVDFENLKQINNSIIYAQITGYGTQNRRAGYDAIIQAESGFTFMNGNSEGPSVKMPVALMDILAAHQTKEAILIALYLKEKNKTAQYIDVSLIKSGIASLANQAANYLVGNVIPKRSGSGHPNIAPYGTIFKTADKKEIVLAIGTDRQFEKLVNILGVSFLAADPKFSKNQQRVVHAEELNLLLQSELIKFKSNEILLQLEERGIPAGGVLNMAEVFEKSDAKEMMVINTDKSGKTISGVKSIAFNFDKKKCSPNLTPPPKYGENTFDILTELLRYDSEKIKNLSSENVISLYI
ncbi:MAG: CaiB/BaiF CoA-transferase family protein [Bacteroidales bacterium]|nr:CaiB/BaiF CoA-transferase family protein [Bacteroidales bacterium]